MKTDALLCSKCELNLLIKDDFIDIVWKRDNRIHILSNGIKPQYNSIETPNNGP